MAKAKILCLHGFGTNANFMKKQATSFMKLIEREAQLIFVDAPFVAPQQFVVDQKVIELIEGDHRSWVPTGMPMEQMKSAFFSELQKVREVFEAASDHYDGILGFSQGAVITHMLLRMKEMRLIDWHILEGIKFSLNLNGNHLKYSLFKNWDHQIDIPSLHIISEEDFLFPKSILHTTQFKNPIVISHSYGHKFPKFGIKEGKIVSGFIRKYSGQQRKTKFKVQQHLKPSL